MINAILPNISILKIINQSFQSIFAIYKVDTTGGDIMAIVANQADSKLKLVFNAGLDEDNKQITKNKTFSKVKATVTNDDLYNMGVAISDLQDHTLMSIVRYEEYQLNNEV